MPTSGDLFIALSVAQGFHASRQRLKDSDCCDRQVQIKATDCVFWLDEDRSIDFLHVPLLTALASSHMLRRSLYVSVLPQLAHRHHQLLKTETAISGIAHVFPFIKSRPTRLPAPTRVKQGPWEPAYRP
jgi:hypothetical protein